MALQAIVPGLKGRSLNKDVRTSNQHSGTMPPASSPGSDSPPLTAFGQHCLLLGAKGAGMTALAEILTDLGNHVTGLDKDYSAADFADNSTPQFKRRPWSESVCIEKPIDLCVASPAIDPHDALLRQLRGLNIQILSLHECLAHVFADSRQVCVAGTHGKSTTSAMLTWILDCAGFKPGFFVGAHQSNFERSGRRAAVATTAAMGSVERPVCVLESCEYSKSFHHFSPAAMILTGIERDHFDCFPDQAAEDAAFQTFIDRIPANGPIVYNARCVRSRRIVEATRRSLSTFQVADDPELPLQKNSETSIATKNCWMAGSVRSIGQTTAFQLHNNGVVHNVQLTVPGRHNVANATAAIAAAVALGVSPEACCEALAGFRGVRRRFEIRGTYNGMTLVDDYAHHPTAIQTTLNTARTAFPNQRIIAAFEPHQIVRTVALFPEFVNSLLLADEILLLPVFPARENVTHLECCRTSGRLVRELNNHGTKAFLFANLDQIVSRIDHSGRPTDIILTMGAGRTNLIHDQLTRRLHRNSVA